MLPNRTFFWTKPFTEETVQVPFNQKCSRAHSHFQCFYMQLFRFAIEKISSVALYSSAAIGQEDEEVQENDRTPNCCQTYYNKSFVTPCNFFTSFVKVLCMTKTTQHWLFL